MFYRFAALAAFLIPAFFAQETTPAPAQALQPDRTDPGVVRAQQDLERVQLLINQGALPAIRLPRAEEELHNAEDLSILRKGMYASDLLPEQADELVQIAQRMVLRRQRAMIDMQQMVASGVITRAEAEATDADFARAQTELRLAQTRVQLMLQMAEAVKLEKAIANIELQAESHPEWSGKLYTRYDGAGSFTPADLEKVSLAFLTRFARTLPVSADGETALHRSLGFNHRGRVDVAVSPDQPEGAWLMRFLETNRIPYFAFRAAVPGQATGAHIHLGPPSTKLALAD